MMEKTITRKYQNVDVGIFLIRLALAIVFLANGYNKLTDIPGTEKFLGSLGFSPFFVYILILLEILGGLAMLFGVWVRITGFVLALVMIVATYTVTFSQGFFGGYDYTLVLFLTSLAVALMGPGKYYVALKKGKNNNGESE